jgi:hypothetical protein
MSKLIFKEGLLEQHEDGSSIGVTVGKFLKFTPS